jgi:predicted dehydrogenase
MTRQSRRQFMQKTLAAAATVTIAGTKSSGQVVGANEAINVAVAGLNGRGSAHVSAFIGMPNVRITHVVDPDSRTFASKVRQIEQRSGTAPATAADIRRVLEDRNLNAVSIATPNHWHALMTIWAAQAGKHVYVEKPMSHNVKEGRIAVEMARRHNVIVQHGTQSRSSGSWQHATELARSGQLGRVLVARGLCYKRRDNSNGMVPTVNRVPAPADLDFNIWLGPAAQREYHENLVHYRWHWFWDFGNGDVGNQGVHQMDIARWGIPGATFPRSVISVGGRFGPEDRGETPNTQISVYDYGETKLIFEVRGLQTPDYMGQGVGNIFHCEEGTIAGNRFFPRGSKEGQPLPRLNRELPRRPLADGERAEPHFRNFIAAIRSGRREDLNADILEGHYSSALCHLGNVSYRLGESAPFNPRTRAFGDNREAVETLERMEEHLRERGVMLDGATYRVGRKLDLDPRTETVVNNTEANRLLFREYRAPFVVPERVG